MRRIFTTVVLASTLGTSVGHTVSLGSAVPTAGCGALLSLSLGDTEISSATPVPQNGAIPAHCRVVGVTHGEPGSNVTVEVRMPDLWNGKLLMTTRQGFMGGLAPVTNPVMSAGLARGYTTLTTDGGHSSGSADEMPSVECHVRSCG